MHTEEQASMAAMGIKAVAKELGISVPSVRRLLKARELGHTRIGRRVVIPAAEVERFQAERFQPAVQAAKGSEG